MQCFLKDADRLKKKKHTINKILADLRDLVYKAEDILADCQLQLSHDANGCLARISPSNLHFKHQNGRRLKEITEADTKKIKDWVFEAAYQGKYLIVIDDVWSDVTWWGRISQWLPKGNVSCIMVTTRIEEVSMKMGLKKMRIHRPEFLNKVYSWLIFHKIAFAASEDECTYPDLEDVGREIVEKCKGLPLAIKVVGGMMHCKTPYYHEWSLSNTHPLIELPTSLEKLTNLQILDLSYCQNLKTSPQNLTILRKLKVLDVSNCDSLKCFPKGLGRLSNLEVLLGFRPARSSCHGCRIEELRNLTRLRILGLHLTHGDEVKDNEVNALVNLHELENLSITYFDFYGREIVRKLTQLRIGSKSGIWNGEEMMNERAGRIDKRLTVGARVEEEIGSANAKHGPG
ncbi:putative ATP binding protein [Hibiscus syriacus]|uniref:ATP binding protein n=1 Tax=Hibiscus syriacus TaxID=106335 RepID=A0A6A3AEH7_HIBSY|nr:putative ATP binding protein [Hibiscus syriacus]